MTYRFEDDSLYLLDLPTKKTGRLLRIGRGGVSDAVASWKLQDGPKARMWLATTYHGDLLLTVAKGAHYRIVQIDVGSPVPRATRQVTGHGRLAAGPQSDAVGVSVATEGPRGALRIEQVTDWEGCPRPHGLKCGPEWCFE